MKRILTFMLMAIIVSVVSYADDFTKAASEVSQYGVKAKVVYGRSGSNQAPYIQLTNTTGKYVVVELKVYYKEKKQVDHKTVSFSGKNHNELFNSIDSMFDNPGEKNFTVSIRVKQVDCYPR